MVSYVKYSQKIILVIKVFFFFLTDNRRLKFQDYPWWLRGDLKMSFKISGTICNSVNFSYL